MSELSVNKSLRVGWVLLKKMFSDRVVEMAQERILLSKIPKGRRFSNTDDRHNNFKGLTWGCCSGARYLPH